MNLLTPKEVAEILQISPRTVYENKHWLGGLYPAGISVLRFRKELSIGLWKDKKRGDFYLRKCGIKRKEAKHKTLKLIYE